MNISKNKSSEGLTRRDLLKGSGVILGGLALGGAMAGAGAGKALAEQTCPDNACGYSDTSPPYDTTQRYDYPTSLYNKGAIFTADMQPQLGSDEMRITFLGTAFPPARKAQQMMSIFVEVGPWVPDSNGGFGKATDSFVFDCGAGALSNYNAMGISASRMDKIFISHLHADHMSDLSAIYCFGPANDRRWPLYVWSHGPSGVKSPRPPRRVYDDGTNAFCKHLREAMRWHSESFSFLETSYYGYPIPTRKDWGTPCDLIPVGDDAPDDGYALVPIELDWTKYGKEPGDNIAYYNPKTGVKITHFPVIHCRKGSMGYKLEWNGLSMIYTSDTRPETMSIEQAKNVDPKTGEERGVDVFIHEMILPPELLTMKNAGIAYPPAPNTNPEWDQAVQRTADIESSSHTPQGAFGYLLTQITPRPRLTVISHFPVADDTVECAMNSVNAHFSSGGPVLGRDIIWSTDLMVLKVKKGQPIEQLIGKVSDYTFDPSQNVPANPKPPKYPTPTAQLEEATLIKPGAGTYCENGY
jgi:ribonuclease Z